MLVHGSDDFPSLSGYLRKLTSELDFHSSISVLRVIKLNKYGTEDYHKHIEDFGSLQGVHSIPVFEYPEDNTNSERLGPLKEPVQKLLKRQIPST